LILGHQFGEHPERVQTLGQAVTVTAVRGGDDVAGSQGPTRPDRRGLLSDREVNESGDFAVAIEHSYPLFKTADHQHPAIHLDEVGDRER
jgi:hypothetical protein